MNVHAPVPDLCSEGPGLISIDEACAKAASYAPAITATEDVPIRRAGGRTLAEEVVATLAMPAFDQSAMDGYALALGGGMLPAGTRMPVEARIAAGDVAGRISEGAAARIFTGAPLPGRRRRRADAGARVARRGPPRPQPHGPARRQHQAPRRGHQRRRGAPLARRATGRPARRPARQPRAAPTCGFVGGRASASCRPATNSGSPEATSTRRRSTNSNRPMIMALAEQAVVDVVDGGWVRDDPAAMARALAAMAATCDLVVTTGGASVGEEDHAATAMALAGARFETLKIALKPGKPAVVGQLGSCAYLGLPGNPVSALVSWLFLGGAVVSALEQRPFRRRLGCPMRSVSHFQRRPGRTEFVPARRQAGSGHRDPGTRRVSSPATVSPRRRAC